LANLRLLKKILQYPLVAVCLLFGAGSLAYYLGKPVSSVPEMHQAKNDEPAIAPPSHELPDEKSRERTPHIDDYPPLGQVRPSLRLTPRRSNFSTMKPGQERHTQPPVAKLEENASTSGALQVSETLAKGAGRTFRETTTTAPPPPASGSMDQSTPKAELPRSETTIALGGGVDRMPRWAGSAKSEIRPVPYIDINWRDQVEFSTVKGLIIDLLHGERWNGGLIGTMVWGRSTRELAGLQVPTLKNTVQGGVYLEYGLTPELTLGARLRHDIQNTRVSYGEIYAELALPKIGYLEHDIRLTLEAMNEVGMRRFFGLSVRDAARLGVAEYNPKAGVSKTLLTYEGFLPTSESTGIAYSANIGRLSKGASDSPLVRNFGSAVQKEFVAAFVYHF
jgi:outer membrane scaffolding protein for murein synthesis (MipA/OmpV family)